MSEQQAEQNGHQTGSPGAGAANPNSSEPAVRAAEAPTIVPDQDEAARARDKADVKADDNALEHKAETTRGEMPKARPFTVEGFKIDAPKSDTVKPDTSMPDAPKGDAPEANGSRADALKNDVAKPGAVNADPLKAGSTRLPRELLTMSPGERNWTRNEDRLENGSSAPKPSMDAPNRGRRFAAMAAMLLLAVVAGAAGGAFATIGLAHPTETPAPNAPNSAALDASVERIDADIMALKAGLERTTSAALTQFNKTSDRLERIEKAQAEPAAKLAKLSEAVDKLRAAASAATPAAAIAPSKDITGTVTAPAGAQAPPMPQLHASPAVTTAGAAPIAEVGRLPTVESWVLRDVSRGTALIEGRSGLYEVMAGDPVPGLGRVDAIRKQDGRWVVVTSKGLIVAR